MAWSSAAFLRGYFERARDAPFLPADEAGLTMFLDRSVFSRARQLQEKGVSGGKDLDPPESVSVLPDGFRRGELGTGLLREDDIDPSALVEVHESL